MCVCLWQKGGVVGVVFLGLFVFVFRSIQQNILQPSALFLSLSMFDNVIWYSKKNSLFASFFPLPPSVPWDVSLQHKRCEEGEGNENEYQNKQMLAGP